MDLHGGDENMSTEISPMKPRVILADDETSIRQTLAFFLRSENVDVIAEARDGPEALEMCQRLRPALLLTDLRLPVLDAMSVLARLRAEKLPTRVMIYTGSEDERQLVVQQHAGAELQCNDADVYPVGGSAGRICITMLGAEAPGIAASTTPSDGAVALCAWLVGGGSRVRTRI